MIVAVSGYNASGKTALVERLVAALEERRIDYKAIKFDSLYLSKRLTRKKKRFARPTATGSLGLRKIEGQRGEWGRRFGWRQLVDVLWAALIVWWIGIVNRRCIIVFDRYFYDRFVHFNPRGMLYRLAERVSPEPHLAFILLPEDSVWEQRLLERIRERFGLSVKQLSEADRTELNHVRNRYETVLRHYTSAIRINSAGHEDSDKAVDHLLCSLTRPVRFASTNALKRP